MGPSVELQLTEATASFLIGIFAGLLYDIFRGIRRGAKCAFVTHFLDGLFLLSVTAALFSLSLAIGFGQQRITDTVISVMGGCFYFAIMSRTVLEILSVVSGFFSRTADFLLRPAKKLEKNIKSIFHYNLKWYRIGHKYKIAVVADDIKLHGGRSHEEKKNKHSGNSPSFGTGDICGSDLGINVRKNRCRVGRKRDAG